MSSVTEIEQAIRQLPPQERLVIARWLLDDMQQNAGGVSDKPAPALPDYSARRRRIFGEKVLPNMVLAARTDERW